MRMTYNGRSKRTLLGYRVLYACVAVALVANLLLILSSVLPNIPLPGWNGRSIVELPILAGTSIVLGCMGLLLIHARHVTLEHLTLIRHSMDAILLTRTDGSILTANPAACEISGYSEAELQAGGRALMLYPDDPEAEAVYRERAEKGYVHAELWMRKKNGRRMRVALSSVVFDYRNEQRTAMIVRDISHRYQSEYERRIVETAFEDVSQGVAVFDREWRMLWVNHATELITGYARDELIGRPAPLRRRLENEAPRKLAEIEHALQSKGFWSGEVHTRRSNGVLYPVHGTMTRIESMVPDQPHYVVTFSDVTAIRDYERKLRDVLQFDPITTLPNRVLFEEKVQQALGQADPDTDTLAVLLINIDDFRTINESYGHQIGDRMLQAAAQRLIETAGDRALIARHAGDSFAVLLSGLSELEDAGLIASRIVSGFRTGFEEGPDGLIPMPVGIGVASFPASGTSLSALLHHAEIALGAVKQTGGDAYRFYETGAEHAAQRFIAMAGEMRTAVENDEFVAHFQPIYDTGTQRVVAMETLARWPRPSRPFIGPADFIPVAERTGLIDLISERMLRQACRHLHKLQDAGFDNMSAAVNLSAHQFRNEDLAECVLNILDEENTAASCIVLEITESLLMDDPEEKLGILEQLRAGGLRMVMDDFGTGYSSLSYLKHFDLDGIKIDRSFIQHLPHNGKDAAIVRTILTIGQELELPVVAEGIENEQQKQFLQQHGCQRLQGYLIGMPMASQDFLSYMEKHAESTATG